MRRLLVVAGCASLYAPTPALAQTSGGVYPSAPAVIEAVACRVDCVDPATAQVGSVVRIVGRDMQRVRKATFLGGPGDRDDRTVPVLRWARRIADVRVPAGALSGRMRVRNGDGAPSRPSVTALPIGADGQPVAPAPPPAPAGSAAHVFPVRGAHTYGSSGARFGASRDGHSHQGQDVVAACGTPLVAAGGGVVRWKSTQARAGNYVVIGPDAEGYDHAYMHLRRPAIVERGQRIAPGQAIGEVGDTGVASGCHLHFELWTAPGWHEGGRPIDPLAALRSWDAAVSPRR